MICSFVELYVLFKYFFCNLLIDVLFYCFGEKLKKSMIFQYLIQVNHTVSDSLMKPPLIV